MGIVSGLVVYFLTWWIVIFTVLPWGVRQPESREDGTGTGAPVNPNLKIKFIITTIISAIIWLIIYYLIEIKIIDFRAFTPTLVKG